MKASFFASLLSLSAQGLTYWEKKVKDSISELYRFSKQLQKCSCGAFYKHSDILTMLAPSCDCCWESTCLCPMSKSSLESVEKIQEMTNNTDKERLFEMSTSDFTNFTKIFDNLQHNMVEVLMNGVENRRNGQCWKCRPMEPECRFPAQFLELNSSREGADNTESFVQPILIDSPVILKMNKAMKIETNLDESLIEDLAQRSTRDTVVPAETASGEGAVPKSTVQSTTTTYVGEVDGELTENQAHALKEEASQPELALAAGQSGILQKIDEKKDFLEAEDSAKIRAESLTSYDYLEMSSTTAVSLSLLPFLASVYAHL